MSKTVHKITHPKGTMQWLTNPGGAIVTKAMNNGRTYQGPLGALANPYGPAPENPDSGQSGAYTPPQGSINTDPVRLGWTNGGYNYANSPWNGQPPTPANPMSFAPPQMSGLPGQQSGGTIPPTGAQPNPPPTSTIVAGRLLKGSLA